MKKLNKKLHYAIYVLLICVLFTGCLQYQEKEIDNAIDKVVFAARENGMLKYKRAVLEYYFLKGQPIQLSTVKSIDSLYNILLKNKPVIYKTSLTVNSKPTISFKKTVHYFRIADINTLFCRDIPKGTVIFVVDTVEYYLCKFNKSTETIATGLKKDIVRKLHKDSNGHIILESDNIWLNL